MTLPLRSIALLVPCGAADDRVVAVPQRSFNAGYPAARFAADPKGPEVGFLRACPRRRFGRSAPGDQSSRQLRCSSSPPTDGAVKG